MRLLGTRAKPFLKWAGGKTQLLEQLSKKLPVGLSVGKVRKYAEPFIGGGAMFFSIAQLYEIDAFFISDANPELFVVYKIVREETEALISKLNEMQKKYNRLSPSEQHIFFYDTRSAFNNTRPTIKFASFQPSWIQRTAEFFFLNHTCFNGLFRINSKAGFNVPFGKYKQIGLFDEDNLRAVADLLEKVDIRLGDFTICEDFVDENTFVYFDPPYRPISKTASFNTYNGTDFGDHEQKRLAAFCRKIDKKGVKWMLSNSDPKNENPNDHFFETLYDGFNISRANASRAINSKGHKRGQISELIITNY
jgi:DNA adenine methylase